jgi:hypothetical protein
VGGHSKIKARIFPGGGFIVDRSITPANRRIVVVDIGGERSLTPIKDRGFVISRYLRLDPAIPVHTWASPSIGIIS